MKEERVNLSNVDIDTPVNAAKQHLQEIGLQIIHEDKFENYVSIKAHKGGKLAAITGSIRDVEILITGTSNNYELTLRTGAWGRDNSNSHASCKYSLIRRSGRSSGRGSLSSAQI